MKELDLGNSDFKSIIENNNYFVDKSLLIREVIKAQKQVILLPRPRRFGKTLNMSMLKSYFDIKQPENEKLFHDLNIWKSDDEIKQKQGKYPIIYLSFKDAKQNTWEDTLKHIKIEIAKLYRNHSYLLNDQLLKDNEKVEFHKIADRVADNVDYEVSIKQLSEYLYRYYQQKTVILIDEYDTPIQSSYKKYYESAISFLRNLMSGAFKDNSFLYKGVITGILRISKESIFTGLNNVTVHTIFDDEFSDKFGFTDKEVNQILMDFGVTTEFQEIKKWYNGYNIGSNYDIYNPWSILNFALSFKNGFKTYWANTSSHEILKEQLEDKKETEIRDEILQLINNETIEKDIDENFVFNDLEKNKELIWSLLTFSGYLTPVKKNGRKTYVLKIPNYEIKTIFQDIVLHWLNIDVKIKQKLLLETTHALTNNDIAKFEMGLKKIIGDTFSYYDMQGNHENIFQSYLLGLLAIIGDDYVIKSNRESGEGRYDIMLIPHDKTKYGIVMEIKRLEKKNSEKEKDFNLRINAKILEAQKQIDNNKYYLELIENKVNKIIKLPIVFAGKESYITPIKK